jgi:hypothetical protein
MVKFKVIDNLLFGVTPHLFIIMFVFIEDPLKVGHSLSELDLFPDLSF